MTELLILFVALSVLNVVLNTLKSILTVNGGKLAAATINAVTFFVYTYVLIYTSAEGLTMLEKASITAACNFVGVFVVKWVEEKTRKDKLWKVEATIPHRENFDCLLAFLKEAKIPCNYIDIDKYYLLNCYCATQKQSACVKEILATYHAKYFVSESKTL